MYRRRALLISRGQWLICRGRVEYNIRAVAKVRRDANTPPRILCRGFLTASGFTSQIIQSGKPLKST